ncbi:DUF3852 domain-containing protein [Anaerorhabdus sp.]|uniref:DUF3852 domain-containing protein n=1 Tax=Anaerorhabdus sp. TaxID=1872524 RepID=UPI002FCC1E6B
MKKLMNKFIISFIILSSMVVQQVYAEGDISGVIEQTWNSAKGQIQTVTNNVIFPALDIILVICLFVKAGSAYFDYRKHGMIEWTAPVILFCCLLFTLTAPQFIWSIV